MDFLHPKIIQKKLPEKIEEQKVEKNTKPGID